MSKEKRTGKLSKEGLKAYPQRNCVFDHEVTNKCNRIRVKKNQKKDRMREDQEVSRIQKLSTRLLVWHVDINIQLNKG
jgi:hypothetical protein